MPDLNLTSFNPLYPMRIHPYNELLNDSNVNIMDKVNAIIDYLNQVGKLTNDVVKDWNTVYQWVMNDGLTTDVSNKIEEMKANGELQSLLNTIFNALTGDMTTLHTTAKDTIVNALNEIDDLAKSNQTQLAEKSSQVVSITYNGVTTQFYNQTTTLYVDVDSNVVSGSDGLSSAKPIKLSDIQTIFTQLGSAFPKLLGTWTVNLTGTTYQGNGTNHLLNISDVDSANYIIFQGASVALGTQPTTIIDGMMNGTTYMHGFYFVNMKVRVNNILFQNFSESSTANVPTGTRAGLSVSGNKGILYAYNVWANNCSWAGLLNQGIPRLYVQGGSFNTNRFGICSMFNTEVTIGFGGSSGLADNVNTNFNNNYQAGVDMASQSCGHVDYCVFTNHTSRALQVDTSSEVNCVSSKYTTNNIAMSAQNNSRILNSNCTLSGNTQDYERYNNGVIDDTNNHARNYNQILDDATNFVVNAPSAGGTVFSKLIPKSNLFGRGKMTEIEVFGRLLNPTGNTSTITLSISDGTNNPTLITINVPTTAGAYAPFYFKFYLSNWTQSVFAFNALTEVSGYVTRTITNNSSVTLDSTKDITLTLSTTFTGAGTSSLNTYRTLVRNVY